MNQYNICDMGQEEVAICESATVALHAFNKSGVVAEETLLIYGVGSIGLLIARWAKASGVKRIIMVDGADEKGGAGTEDGLRYGYAAGESG